MEEGPPPAGYRESRDDERGVPRQCPRSDMGCGGRSGRSAGLTPSALLSFPAFGVMCWRKVMRRRENKYRRRWYAWPTWEAIESIPTFACLGIVRRGIVFSKRSRGRSASSARLEDLADPSVVRTSQRAKSLKSRSRAGFAAETQKKSDPRHSQSHKNTFPPCCKPQYDDDDDGAAVLRAVCKASSRAP